MIRRETRFTQYEHLDEEVKHISPENLKVFDEPTLRKLMEKIDKHAKSSGDPFVLVPYMRRYFVCLLVYIIRTLMFTHRLFPAIHRPNTKIRGHLSRGCCERSSSHICWRCVTRGVFSPALQIRSDVLSFSSCHRYWKYSPYAMS